ncbi:MAG: GNAT family N-acetyltransferase [Acidimicrobiales bacterium]
MGQVTIRAFTDADLPWAERLLGGGFGGRLQVRLGSVVDPLACPGLVAEADGDPVGIVTFDADGTDVEVVYIEVMAKHLGVGTSLLEALEARTRAQRLWLVTTNDNLDALRFYQRRGFRITEIRPGAVDEARRTLKPSISDVGGFGIPIRDEIVLERLRH